MTEAPKKPRAPRLTPMARVAKMSHAIERAERRVLTLKARRRDYIAAQREILEALSALEPAQ